MCMFVCEHAVPKASKPVCPLVQVPVTVVYLDRSEHFGEVSDAGDMAANVHNVSLETLYFLPVPRTHGFSESAM